MLSRLLLTSLLVLGCVAAPMNAAAPADPEVERGFTQTVQPFLNTYCTSCHGGAKPAAQLDLRQYSTAASVVQDFSRWNRVLARLTASEMPPKSMTQPSDQARRQVIDWIQATWATEARQHDGDPGVVLARRLSNVEYDYTIRDLTGIDMRPAREFPVDPANQAGFDNSGESLAMSPALLNKYLLAARDVADHMFLNASGFAFAPHPMLVETDRDRYAIQQIVDFYARQNTDYADYFRAAWIYKHRAVLGTPKATLADVARLTKVSAKYLTTIWQTLETKEDVGPLVKLQAMWRALPVPKADQPELAGDGANQMREFVDRMRKDTSLKFASPIVKGLSPTTQPLMNWKNRAYATHRRDFDRAALRVEGEPPPPAPVIPIGRDGKPLALGLVGTGPNGEDLTTLKAQVTGYTSRMENADLVVPAGQRDRYEAAFAKFSAVFPDAFFVRERGRFYPDDSEDKGRLLSAGFHNVMGYTRDDTPLSELLLDEKGQKELETLWDQFEFVADYTARTYVQFYFNQSGEVLGNGRESGTLRPSDKEVTAEAVILNFKTSYLGKAAADDAKNPVATQAINDHFDRVNATLRGIERERLEAEPRQLDALMTFAARAYRRPLSPAERADLMAFYRSLRDTKNLSHEEAMRDSIVSVLMSPYFCYRLDLADGARSARGEPFDSPLTLSPSKGERFAQDVPVEPRATLAGSSFDRLRTSGAQDRRTHQTSVPSAPLSDYALASRLSYFLWSSMPDEELLARAAAGGLRKDAVLRAQIRRMLNDDRARGLATEFGGNWLDFRRFEDSNTVDRERFPAFTNELREAMFEEPIRFLGDLIRNDRPVLNLLYGRYTFVNPILAHHYGMPEVSGGPDHWVRVDQASDYARGGLLPMAVFLTQNAPGLRTSPVKRGYWVARRVLGEVIPPPPPVVPELPSDEAKLDLPLRDVLAKHRSNPACAACHARFDAFGLTLENYGPVGETRTRDLAGHPVDTQASFPGGGQGNGLSGLQAYIRANREKDFLDNFSRKLLVYALGRSLLLSDEPLIQRINHRLAASGYRASALIQAIVTSPQFLNRRTADSTTRKVAN
jgi:mono/diheme cytochrome c family protein